MQLERLGSYQILDEIGQGGMSVVYRARDAATDREVAVKVLHRHLARDPEARQRFAREAKAVARLKHRNIPMLHAFSAEDEETSYLVTELVDGAPFSTLLRDHDVLPETGALVVLGVAEALGCAHDHGIIHRDVKPENILVGRDGVVRLTDFGIAQLVDLESMTVTGTLVGSPAHMSPEQIEGNVRLDARSDIWGLGTVLYAAVTDGALPFDATTPHGVLRRILEGQFTDPRRVNPHVDSVLTGIIRRCLQVDRTRRYASTAEIASALRAWLEDRGIVDAEAEIKAWMAAPEAYWGELAARLVDHLQARAEAGAARGERHRAIEDYGRVLTLAPDHEAALQGLKRLHARLRWGRVARGVALAALLAAAAVGIWKLATAEPSVPGAVAVSRPAQADLGGLDAGVAPTADASAHRSPKLPSRKLFGRRAGAAVTAAGRRLAIWARVRAEARRPGRAAGRALASAAATVRPLSSNRPRSHGLALARRVRVRVTAAPLAAQLTVDGRAVEKGETLSLRPGRHVARLHHPACNDCKDTTIPFRVPNTTSPQHRHFRFRYDPTVVTVQCPAGGRVSIEGRGGRGGACGASIRVPILSHLPEARLVRVTLPTGATRSRRFIFKPGARIRWTVQ